MAYFEERQRLYNLNEANNTKKLNTTEKKMFCKFLSDENETLDSICMNINHLDELKEKYLVTHKQ